MGETHTLTQVGWPQSASVSGIKGLWGPFITGVPWLTVILPVLPRVDRKCTALRAPMSRPAALTLCLLPLVLHLLLYQAATGHGE